MSLERELARRAVGQGLFGPSSNMDIERELALKAVERGLFGIPSTIGRYTTSGTLGVGGMGTVYLARDPQLERSVAIKMLKTTEGSTEEAQERLLREAKALATLSHPNIVAVYEVGTYKGECFIAMEYVAGRTLGEWLSERKPNPTQVLEMFVTVGRGLAAAHDEGIVHRDFKPANVMVGNDGRPRILDFGIAKTQAVMPGPDDAGDERSLRDELVRTDEESGDPMAPRLTATGMVAGTLLYMAPEQHAGLPADPRSDQFSFCVALYDALYGEHPFRPKPSASEPSPTGVRDELRELMNRVWGGQVGDPPQGVKVDPSVRKIVLKGLEVEPAARHPDMRALLVALEGVNRKRAGKRSAWLAGAMTLSAGLVAWYLWPRDACGGVGEASAAIWSDEHRMAVEQRFAETGLPYAARSWALVDERLGAYARGLAAVQLEACEARPALSVAAAQAQCFEWRQQQLAGLIERFEQADAVAVEQAFVAVAQALDDPARCLDRDYLALQVPPPAGEAAEEVAALRPEIIDVEQLRVLGNYPESWQLGQQVMDTARAIGHAPTEVQALYAAGVAAHHDGQTQTALRLLEDAYFLASKIPHEEFVARIAVALVVVATRNNDAERAHMWSKHADAAIERISAMGHLRSDWLENQGVLLQFEGNYEAALASYEQSLQVIEDGVYVDLLKQSSAHSNIGAALIELGRYDDAIGHFEEAIAYFKEALKISAEAPSPEHPEIAAFRDNIGTAYDRLGRHEDARKQHEQALAIAKAALGPEHPRTVIAHANLGVTLSFLGRFEEALEHLEHGLEVSERAGTDPLATASLRAQIGMTLLNAQKPAPAIAMLERALQDTIAVLGNEHPGLGPIASNLAFAHAIAGHNQEAIAAFERALELGKRELGESHLDVATLHANLGTVLGRAGRKAEAVDHQRRALEIRKAYVATPTSDLALSHHNIGVDLADLGHRAEAIAEFREAVRLAREAPPEHSHRIRLGRSLIALGTNLSLAGDDDAATSTLEEARQILASSEPVDALALASSLTALGEHHLRRDRSRAALAVLERAAALSLPSGADEGYVAKTHFGLARALVETGGARQRAVRLAEQAREVWARLGPGWDDNLQQVSRWLAQHGRRAHR
jgi:serine/threonine protein kinase/tetratricopeptide (TPR) repeat protein